MVVGWLGCWSEVVWRGTVVGSTLLLFGSGLTAPSAPELLVVMDADNWPVTVLGESSDGMATATEDELVGCRSGKDDCVDGGDVGTGFELTGACSAVAESMWATGCPAKAANVAIASAKSG